MNHAGAAPEPVFPMWELWVAACAVLSCLFLVSTVVLVIVLIRRNRKEPGA